MAKRKRAKRKPTGSVYNSRIKRWVGPGVAWLTTRSKTSLAQLFAVTAATIQDWEFAMGLPVEEDGTYDLVRVVRWRIDFLLDKAGDHANAKPTLQHQKLEQEIRQRRLKADVLEQSVLNRDEVESAHRELITLIASRLDEVPAAAASACPPEVASRVRAIVEDAISSARKDLAAAALS